MLEALTGKDVRCIAYPCGGVNNVLIVNACNFAFSML